MINLKDDLSKFLKNKPKPIQILISWETPNDIAFQVLNSCYDKNVWNKFLDKIDIEIDNSIESGNKLVGSILFEDYTTGETMEFNGYVIWRYSDKILDREH